MTKILVIEDEKLVRENIIDLLAAEDFDTIAAANGRIGVELAVSEIPDLILCDLMMPEIDGFGVLTTLREEPVTATIPFIFLTAKSARSDFRQGMDLGADDYLTKPFTRTELLNAITSRLAKQATFTKQVSTKLEVQTFSPKAQMMEMYLRRTIEQGDFQQFLVYYQPIVSLLTGKIAGFEALVRWQHPIRGLILPAEFIPVAEETGLINAINTWVLQSACQQLHLWQHHPAIPETLTISVNLSARLFSQPNLIAQIDEILYETKVNPENLELEITESVIMENSQAVKTILNQLQERRIKLIMDDFGTGYSSLSYLHSFPLNALKIDKSFVKRMQENQEDMGLVPAMIGIADSMGMRAIAEGVETTEQLAQLRSLNCEFAQGFLFSRPIEQQSVLNLLTAAPQW
ncbi:MAG: EAL domain-containing response regulator [Scytonema sp. CRU_2_7]|nr:EAL domain-containing response regulator [Scytonema sp. CRU_2_7]